MSLLPSDFDATTVDPNTAFEPVPAGTYTVMIIASEMKDTQAGDGQYLKLEFKILDEGEFNGRKIWTNLNLVNPNEKAVEIAQKELSGIMHAVDRVGATDSNELHGLPMSAKVKVRPPQNGYDASNTISFFKSLDEAEAEGGYA